MFEDIIIDKKKLKEDVEKEICPFCGSSRIIRVNGIFKSANKYIITFRCVDCTKLWHAAYNADLNITDVTNGE